MLSRIRQGIDGATVGAMITGVTGQATLVVSGVILARVLGAHDRGLLAVMVSVSLASALIFSFGLPTAAALSIARHDSSLAAIWRELRPVVLIQAAVLIVVPLTMITIIGVFPTDTIPQMATCAVVGSLSILGGQYMLAVLQGQQRFRAFNSLRLVYPATYAFLVAVAFLAGADAFDVFAIMWTVGALVGAIAISRAVFRGRRSDGAEVLGRRELLTFGLKAQIGKESPLENFNIDQLLIGAIGGPFVLGIYVVGFAFTNLPRFLSQSLGMVVFPRVASKMNAGGAGRVAEDALLLTIALTTVVVAVLELAMGWLVPFFFGEAFHDSIDVARVLLVASAFLSVRRVLGDSLRGAGRPVYETVAEVVSWVVFAAMIYPMTANHGAVGAAVAFTAASVVSSLLVGGAAVYVRRSGLMIAVPELRDDMTYLDEP